MGTLKYMRADVRLGLDKETARNYGPVSRMDPAGNKLWEISRGGNVIDSSYHILLSQPALSIYVGHENVIKTFDLENGQLIWSEDLDRKKKRFLVDVRGGLMFIDWSGGKMSVTYKDQLTGKINWSKSLDRLASFKEPYLKIHEESVIIVAGNLIKMDLMSGRVEMQTREKIGNALDVLSTEDYTITLNEQNEIEAFSIDGTRRWSFTPKDQTISMTMAGDSRLMLHTAAIDYSSFSISSIGIENGKVDWQTDFDGLMKSNLADNDSVVYFSSYIKQGENTYYLYSEATWLSEVGRLNLTNGTFSTLVSVVKKFYQDPLTTSPDQLILIDETLYWLNNHKVVLLDVKKRQARSEVDVKMPLSYFRSFETPTSPEKKNMGLDHKLKMINNSYATSDILNRQLNTARTNYVNATGTATQVGSASVKYKLAKVNAALSASMDLQNAATSIGDAIVQGWVDELRHHSEYLKLSKEIFYSRIPEFSFQENYLILPYEEVIGLANRITVRGLKVIDLLNNKWTSVIATITLDSPNFPPTTNPTVTPQNQLYYFGFDMEDFKYYGKTNIVSSKKGLATYDLAELEYHSMDESFEVKWSTQLIDDTGQIIFTTPHEIEDFHEGLAKVKTNPGDKTKVFVDINGNEHRFECGCYIEKFDQGLAIYGKGILAGLMNKEGKVIMKPSIYRSIADFEGNPLTIAKEEDGRGDVIDRKGNVLYTGKEGENLIRVIDEQKVYMKVGKKYVLYDFESNQVITSQKKHILNAQRSRFEQTQTGSPTESADPPKISQVPIVVWSKKSGK